MQVAPSLGIRAPFLLACMRLSIIDENGGADSHAPCVVGVSQAVRSLRQVLACKRVLVRMSAPP